MRSTWQGAQRVLLGFFVIWQLLFLFSSNLLPLIPHGEPEFDELSDDISLHGQATSIKPIQQAIEGVSLVSDRWMEATGQLQGWSLFAPIFPPQAGFVAVEFQWKDGSRDLVHSRFKPADPLQYCRLPGTDGRLFNYESRFVILPVFWPKSKLGPDGGPWDLEWSAAITERARVQWKSMHAYIRWQIQRYMKDHPGVHPPAEVIMLVELYVTPGLGDQPWAPQGPVARPLARWRLEVSPPPGFLPMEVCTDPAKEHFEWLPVRK